MPRLGTQHNLWRSPAGRTFCARLVLAALSLILAALLQSGPTSIPCPLSLMAPRLVSPREFRSAVTGPRLRRARRGALGQKTRPIQRDKSKDKIMEGKQYKSR